MTLIPANTVYVYSFAPTTEEDGVGGFFWHSERTVMETMYIKGVQDSAHFGGSHTCRLLRVGVFADPCHDVPGVDDELDSRLDELECTTPALRQYVPAKTTRDRLPTARRER